MLMLAVLIAAIFLLSIGCYGLAVRIDRLEDRVGSLERTATLQQRFNDYLEEVRR